MRKIKETKEYKDSLKGLKDRKHLLLEARYALQKILDLEREEPVLGDAMEKGIRDDYRSLGHLIDALEQTESKAVGSGEKPESELIDTALDILAEGLGLRKF